MSEPLSRARLREQVAQRAHDLCEYCLSPARYSPQAFSIEHIIPRSRGGATVLNNLALSCQGRNNFKHTKITGFDAASHEWVPLYHPRQHLWRDHFSWNDDCSLIIGLTPTGRATIETLQLNRESVVNLRRMLYAFGEHPPTET